MHTKSPRRLAAMLLCLALLMAYAPAVFAADEAEYALREYVVSEFVQSVGRSTMGTSDYILSSFADASEIGEAYFDDLSRAVNAGVLRGYSDGTLRPKDPIRRVEALVLFSRILPELEAVQEPIAFSDVPGWAREDIDRLSAAGLVLGYGDGTLGSDDLITVEQVGLLTDRSDALLNRWTPGENYFAYINDKAFRNYIPDAPTVDAAHGVILYNDEEITNGFVTRANEIREQEDALLRALGSGELAYEKGSPAQRLYDLYDCCVHKDEDMEAEREWVAGLLARLLDAETPADFVDAWTAVFRESAVSMIFNLIFRADSSHGVLCPCLESYFMLPAAMLAFDAETEPAYRDELTDALTAFGEALGGDFTPADAEAACELQKLVGAGTDYADYYAGWLGYLLGTGRMPEETDEAALDARMESIRAQHPDLYGEDADTEDRVMTQEEVAALAADPLLDVTALLRLCGFGDFVGVYLNAPRAEVLKHLRITEENLGGWKLTAAFCLCDSLKATVTDAQWNALMRCVYAGMRGIFGDAYSFEDFDAWYSGTDPAEAEDEPESDEPESEAPEDEPEDEAPEGEMPEEDFVDALRSLAGDWLADDIGNLWCENYYDPAIAEEVRSLLEDILQVYRTRFAALEWMDDETCAAALRKLDELIINIGWERTEGPEILSRAEGGNYLINTCGINRFNMRRCIRQCADADVCRRQRIGSPDTVNAMYAPGLNSIDITPAILGGGFNTRGGDYAENLGRIGMVLGHEIGHAFDTTGSQYDEHGIMQSWMSEETAAVYQSLADRFLTYYENYEYIEGVWQDPNITVGESMSDFSGMTMVMDLLKDDPDAQRAALEAYAEMWLEIMTEEMMLSFLEDEHPASHVRVNSIVSSLDAFYELYDISEDDPMYVAPEDRLQLW